MSQSGRGRWCSIIATALRLEPLGGCLSGLPWATPADYCAFAAWSTCARSASAASGATRKDSVGPSNTHTSTTPLLYERELLWRLLTGEQGAIVRQIGLAGSHLNHLGHAIGWLRGRYREPMRIDELAALSAMSPRSLHRHSAR